MSRLLFTLFLGLLLTTASGCRNTCGNQQSKSASNTRPDMQPYALTSGGPRMMEGCYDAITGRPVPCPPSTMVLPGNPYQGPPPGIAAPSRPDELPFPAPSDMIPRPGVPYAPPMPAPGTEGASLTPKAGTTPVKAGPKQ